MQIKTLTSDLFEENTYIIENNNSLVVVDPGGSILEIQSVIASMKYRLKYVLLTHGHYDHILSAQALGVPVFAHEKEKTMLEDPAVNLSARVIKPSISLKAVNYFRGNPHKMDEFEIYHTPGHSAGSVVIKTEDSLFTGDTLFLDTVGRTDAATGDSKQLQASLKVFNSFDKNLMCYPGHGEPFLLADAYAANYFLK